MLSPTYIVAVKICSTSQIEVVMIALQSYQAFWFSMRFFILEALDNLYNAINVKYEALNKSYACYSNFSLCKIITINQ